MYKQEYWPKCFFKPTEESQYTNLRIIWIGQTTDQLVYYLQYQRFINGNWRPTFWFLPWYIYILLLSFYILKHRVESWKRALDRGDNVEAIMMDLSKAFDNLSQELLIEKLGAYCFINNACNCIFKYLWNWQQSVKICEVLSSSMDLAKGVPQGSILGTQLFNILFNDIYFFVECRSTI